MFRSPMPRLNPLVLLACLATGMGTAARAQAVIGDPGEGRSVETAPPVVTMAPHPADSRYWLSGQANIIFQGRLPFHALYGGTNSFRNSAEYKTSMLGTVFTAARLTHSIRYSNDLIFDLESAGGRGLSEALGLGGITDLDVVRNPNLGSTPYPARNQTHQVIGLTQKTTSQEP
ncbi:MAG: porin, partial [Terracidiphilus sp.]|nr:porin [Terracidiphilus sp.]